MHGNNGFTNGIGCPDNGTAGGGGDGGDGDGERGSSQYQNSHYIDPPEITTARIHSELSQLFFKYVLVAEFSIENKTDIIILAYQC